MANEVAIEHVMDVRTPTSPADLVIAELARRQYGVVGRAQLRELGLGRGAIEHRLRCGRLHRKHPGVYAVGHPLLTLRGRLMAAVLATPGAVSSHRSAASLWGFVDYRGVPEVTVPVPRAKRRGLRMRTSTLAEDEHSILDAIPVTTVSRTLLDLAAVLPLPRLELAIDRAESVRATDPLPLAALLARHPGRRGTANLTLLVEEKETTAQAVRSELEADFFALVRTAGLPKPVLNLPILAGATWHEADIAWPHARLTVELDSRAHHHTAGAFERDRAKDRALAVAGWRTIRVTWKQLASEPGALLADLTCLLGGR